MNLLVRINVALGATLGVAGLALGYGCWTLLQTSAKHDAVREASLMMESALATQTYTTTEILPLLASRMSSEFLPQSVPFYAATQHFVKLREQHPEYFYKEAALNPTNPRDRATDWESDLIQQFRSDPATHEIIGERDTPMGRSLYLARPIRMASECLPCHSSAATAPATLVARYGRDNGFGWQPHEVVGAHVVSVPLATATAGAEATFRNIMIWMAAVLVALLLIVNGVVYLLVVRPVRRITAIADRASVGEPSDEFPTGGGSELAALSQSFNRMRISLEKAMKLLES